MNYADLQTSKDREYRDAYEKWVSSLSEEERNALDLNKLGKPSIDSRGVGAPELDESRLSQDEIQQTEVNQDRLELQAALRRIIAELLSSNNTSYTVALLGCALQVRRITLKAVAERFDKRVCDVSRATNAISKKLKLKKTKEDQNVLRIIVGEIASSSNALLSTEVLALVTGICYQGASQTEIAAKHKVTRAAVSKRCVEICEHLGLPPARAMKSEIARQGYSEAQIDHWAKNRG